ncbi:hypothetical protein KR009_001467, partial [Drosophila setifemur]
MAFSTQKEFFHIPFMNEPYECKDSCVKLKSYPSSVDDRSWSSNQDKKSRFVADLVACNTPILARREENSADFGVNNVSAGLGSKIVSAQDEYGSSFLFGDSLIIAADDTIGRMQDLMIKNNILQIKLEDSHDKLLTAKEENADIRRILEQRYNPEKSKELKKKIKQLIDDSKIDSQDEKELNDIQRAVDDMNKAHDILEAENSNLKRLIEKQSKRCRLDSIQIDPEKSTDVQYLQGKITDMGKELTVLRQVEDDLIRKQAKISGVGTRAVSAKNNGDGDFSSEKDISSIQRILAERDALRKKCKNLEALADKINQFEKKANEAEHLSGDLEDNLNQQNQYINDIQQEMQDMQNYYESEVDKAKGNEEILKCRCDQMKQELMTAKCAVQRTECQKIEIDVLRNELQKRDMALNEYDCQYQ